MRFIWSRNAGRDRDNIFDRIATDKLSAAAANDTKIAGIESQLLRFPESGRTGRLGGTRELVITGTPYIAIYAIQDDRIVVLAVIHGAQQWPPRRED